MWTERIFKKRRYVVNIIVILIHNHDVKRQKVRNCIELSYVYAVCICSTTLHGLNAFLLKIIRNHMDYYKKVFWTYIL